MGGNSSKDNKNRLEDPTEGAELFDETGECKFYRQKKTGIEYEKYQIENDGSKNFENKYEFRLKNRSPFLVDAYYAKASQNAFGCTSSEKYEVVTERIPQRLSNLEMVPMEKSFHYLQSTLKGFHQLYKSLGLILVKDSMIGVNKKGKAKVWLNENFAANSPEPQPLSYKTLEKEEDRESAMVDNIIELINSKTERKRPWMDMVDEKYHRGKMGFDQAVSMVSQYIRNYNIPQPGSSEKQLDQRLQSLELNHEQTNTITGLQRSDSKQKSFRIIEQSQGMGAQSQYLNNNNREFESATIHQRTNPTNSNNSKPNSNFANVRQKVTGLPQQSERFIQHFPPQQHPVNNPPPPHQAPIFRNEGRMVISSDIDHSFNKIHSIDRSLNHGRTRTTFNNVSPQPRIQFNGHLMRSGEESQVTRSVSESKSKIMGLQNTSLVKPVENRPAIPINNAHQNHPIINPLNYIQPNQLQSQYIQQFQPPQLQPQYPQHPQHSQHPQNPQYLPNQRVDSINSFQNTQMPKNISNQNQEMSPGKPEPSPPAKPLQPSIMNIMPAYRPPVLNTIQRGSMHKINKEENPENPTKNEGQNQIQNNSMVIQKGQNPIESLIENEKIQSNGQERDQKQFEENDYQEENIDMVHYNQFQEEDQGSPTVPPAPLPSPEMQSPASVKMVTFARRKLKKINPDQERGENQIMFGNFGQKEEDLQEEQEQEPEDIEEDYSPLRQPRKIKNSSTPSKNFEVTDEDYSGGIRLNKINSTDSNNIQTSFQQQQSRQTHYFKQNEEQINENRAYNQSSEQSENNYSFQKKDQQGVEPSEISAPTELLQGRVVERRKEGQEEDKIGDQSSGVSQYKKSGAHAESIFASQTGREKFQKSRKGSNTFSGAISYKDLRDLLRSTRSRN